MVGADRLLLPKDDATTALSTSVVYRSVSRHGHCVSCGMYRDTPTHWCIIPVIGNRAHGSVYIVTNSPSCFNNAILSVATVDVEVKHVC